MARGARVTFAREPNREAGGLTSTRQLVAALLTPYPDSDVVNTR
jgi:hypothetical protein